MPPLSTIIHINLACQCRYNLQDFTSSNHLLGDCAIGLNNDLFDLQRGFDGVRLGVHPLELLESAALGFNTDN